MFMASDAIDSLQRRRTLRRAVSSTVRSSFFWTFAVIGVAGIICRLWLTAQSDPAGAIRALGVMAPLAAVALQTMTMMTPVGSSVIPTLNGMLFPLAVAVALNLAGGLAGAIGMYYVWRHGERKIGIQKRLGALPAWARRFAGADLTSLTVLRMLPWAGGNLSTLIAGAYHIPLRVHILSVLLGSLPGSIIYALLGAGMVAF
jgi:uncharacterized membrane protein YdjX (TVP38/TMEM64 family)